MLARNQKLSKAHAEDANVIAEMRKILEIEGLLKAYADRLTYYADSTEYRIYPKNDYSGLNSLRARLAHKDWNGMGKPKTSRSLEYSFSVSDSISWNKYVAEMAGGTSASVRQCSSFSRLEPRSRLTFHRWQTWMSLLV